LKTVGKSHFQDQSALLQSLEAHIFLSYAQKLVTALSGGVFDLFNPVLERYSFDELGALV
jgi:hypothetical protein